jgi:hypothetical protein
VTLLLVVGAVRNRFTIEPVVSVNPEIVQVNAFGAAALDALQIPGPLAPLAPPLNTAQVFAATHP